MKREPRKKVFTRVMTENGWDIREDFGEPVANETGDAGAAQPGDGIILEQEGVDHDKRADNSGDTAEPASNTSDTGTSSTESDASFTLNTGDTDTDTDTGSAEPDSGSVDPGPGSCDTSEPDRGGDRSAGDPGKVPGKKKRRNG